MNRAFLAVGLLSAGMAFGQNQTTGTSSTTTSTSNYNSSNTNNENSRNATMGTNGSTNRPMSGTSVDRNSGGNMGTSGMSTGSYSTSSTTGGSYNSMGTGTSTTTPSTTGSYNRNSMGTGTSTTTPSTTGSYNSGSNMGTTTTTTNSTYSTARPERTKDYKNFAYGVYVGVNTTKFKGEALDANGAATALTGRLGYQAGFYVRGGGRLFGQLGAEYFASSSNYFTTGQGTTPTNIKDQINIKYIQVPVYIGYKLTESDRGISAVRVQLGVEYANQIGSTANQFGNLKDFQVKSGTFNGLGQLGFDAGPVFLDLTYHYGFSNAVQQNAGFAGSQRRILSASFGFKF